MRISRSSVPSSCQAFFSWPSASAPASRSTSASVWPLGWPSSGRAFSWILRASSPLTVLYQSGAVVNSSASAATNTTQSDGRSRAKVKGGPRAGGAGICVDGHAACSCGMALVAHGDEARPDDAERGREGDPDAELAPVGPVGQVEHPEEDHERCDERDEA